MLAPRWDFNPLSDARAARTGDRWNEPGQAALYLSGRNATAIAEYQQDPRHPTCHDLDASTFLDLAAPAIRRNSSAWTTRVSDGRG